MSYGVFLFYMRGLRSDFGRIDWMESMTDLINYLRLDKLFTYR